MNPQALTSVQAGTALTFTIKSSVKKRTSTMNPHSTGITGFPLSEYMDRSGCGHMNRAEFYITEAGRRWLQDLRDRGETIPTEARNEIDMIAELVAQMSRIADSLERIAHSMTGGR
jgi:hypothetical protein